MHCQPGKERRTKSIVEVKAIASCGCDLAAIVVVWIIKHGGCIQKRCAEEIKWCALAQVVARHRLLIYEAAAAWISDEGNAAVRPVNQREHRLVIEGPAVPAGGNRPVAIRQSGQRELPGSIADVTE